MTHTLKVLLSLFIAALLMPLAACGNKSKTDARSSFVSNGNGADANPEEAGRNAPTEEEGRTDGDVNGDNAVNDEQTDDERQDSVDAIKEAVPTIGIRNYDQINYTLASLTGVDSSQVFDKFLEYKSQLPDNNSIKEVSPAKVSGLTKLAAEYCNVAMADDALAGAILPGVNLNQGPGQAFADPNAIATMLLDNLWGKDLDMIGDRTGDIDIVATLINDLIAQSANGNDSRFVAMGACAAVLSSAPVLVL